MNRVLTRLAPLLVAAAAVSLAAQTFTRRTARTHPTRIVIPTLGQGHALRKPPNLRPFIYLTNPSPTNTAERSFANALPGVRAGRGVGRNRGDYYVDPTVWINNANAPANATIDPNTGILTDPNGQWVWRDPNSVTNWISTRAIRIWLRLTPAPW